MKLTAKDLKALTHGALTVKECADGYIHFYRFSDKQIAYYENTNTDFYHKAFATASLRFEAVTDASAISFSYHAEKMGSRKFFYFDLFVDGAMVAHVGAEGELEKDDKIMLSLPEGTHRIALYFPALYQVSVKDMVLENATFATPVEKKLKMLALGDSITHGYDAVYSALSYINITADALDASLVNQAIGAEIFNPGIVDGNLGFTPDIVTVAYGTNDFNKCTRAAFTESANEFYARLRSAFPNAKIFALLPIWRADGGYIHTEVTFDEAREIVRAAAEAQTGITVIDAYTFVPHLPAFYSDEYLHPNDLGSLRYAAGLLQALKQHL